MKKSKKLYRNLLIIIFALYAMFTLLSQQKTLNQYSRTSSELTQKIETEKETKEELAKQKDNVNSLEFIEKTAREMLEMYYPNEKVYVNRGM